MKTAVAYSTGEMAVPGAEEFQLNRRNDYRVLAFPLVQGASRRAAAAKHLDTRADWVYVLGIRSLFWMDETVS
jgi:hypothetical protein